MADNTSGHINVLAQLAREYQQKYQELEDAIQNAQPESRLQRLRARAELTTDRFRAAQQALLINMAPSEGKNDNNAYNAAITLCRCFDEMRILFQFLLEYSSNPTE